MAKAMIFWAPKSGHFWISCSLLGVHERYLQNCEIAEFAEVENGIGHETHRGWQGHIRQLPAFILKG